MILRLGRLELTIRVRPSKPCGACSGDGWFYTKGTSTPVPPPPGYDGVALCGCGTATDRVNDTRRELRRARRRARTEAPF
jgi:hypothetical protein